jgi:hypothetical protein
LRGTVRPKKSIADPALRNLVNHFSKGWLLDSFVAYYLTHGY